MSTVTLREICKLSQITRNNKRESNKKDISLEKARNGASSLGIIGGLHNLFLSGSRDFSIELQQDICAQSRKNMKEKNTMKKKYGYQ